MPIVFSAVACDRNIVADFASCDGNFTEIAEQVLSKLPPCNNKMTYSHGIYLLHYVAEDDCLYFCITDRLCQRSRAFLFLNEIQRRFIASKQINEFTAILAIEMYRYSEDYSTIEIRKGELDEINSIGVGCSESILGEKILYINNPDIISYSTISNVRATPGIISVLVASSISEGISDIIPTIESVSVEGPILERISVKSLTPERTSTKNLTPNRTSVTTPTQEETSVNTSTPERTLIKTPIPERSGVKTPTPERISVETPTPDRTIKTPTPERTLVETPTPERILVKTLTPERTTAITKTPERPSITDSTLEKSTIKTPTFERISVRTLTPEKLSVENPTPETTLIKTLTGETVLGPASDNITAITSTSERVSVHNHNSRRVPDVIPNTETISSLNPTADRVSAMSSMLYVVIIGMIILVITMLVYAFGPISCAIVTGVGIYSLFKSYEDSKHRSE